MTFREKISAYFDFCRETSYQMRLERMELRERVINMESSFEVLCHRVRCLEYDNTRMKNDIAYLMERSKRK